MIVEKLSLHNFFDFYNEEMLIGKWWPVIELNNGICEIPTSQNMKENSCPCQTH